MTAIRDLNLYWGKIENSAYSGQHKLIGNALGVVGRSGNNANMNFPLLYDVFQFADMINDKSIWKGFPNFLRIVIESRRKDVAVFYEVSVAHQSGSKIAKPYHCEV